MDAADGAVEGDDVAAGDDAASTNARPLAKLNADERGLKHRIEDVLNVLNVLLKHAERKHEQQNRVHLKHVQQNRVYLKHVQQKHERWKHLLLRDFRSPPLLSAHAQTVA